jgi:hypothetical protein
LAVELRQIFDMSCEGGWLAILDEACLQFGKDIDNYATFSEQPAAGAIRFRRRCAREPGDQTPPSDFPSIKLPAATLPQIATPGSVSMIGTLHGPVRERGRAGQLEGDVGE